MWEYHNQAEMIPNWAWGHALMLQIIHPCCVPPGTPKDFEWPDMQLRRYEQKQHRQPTAFNTYSPNVAAPWQRQETLMQARPWMVSPAKPALDSPAAAMGLQHWGCMC